MFAFLYKLVTFKYLYFFVGLLLLVSAYLLAHRYYRQTSLKIRYLSTDEPEYPDSACIFFQVDRSFDVYVFVDETRVPLSQRQGFYETRLLQEGEFIRSYVTVEWVDEDGRRIVSSRLKLKSGDRISVIGRCPKEPPKWFLFTESVLAWIFLWFLYLWNSFLNFFRSIFRL